MESEGGTVIRSANIAATESVRMSRWGLWVEKGTGVSAQLGFVPREVNDAIGERPVAATLVAMYAAVDGKGSGLRIDVWGTRM